MGRAGAAVGQVKHTEHPKVWSVSVAFDGLQLLHALGVDVPAFLQSGVWIGPPRLDGGRCVVDFVSNSQFGLGALNAWNVEPGAIPPQANLYEVFGDK